LSDTSIVDNAAESVATSTPVAPAATGSASGTPESTPASVDTTATPAQPTGDTPDKQSRRESRAFAAQRRENRELQRALGRMDAELAALRSAQQGNQPSDGQSPRQERSPAQGIADPEMVEHARSVRERIEDAGDEIEGFDKVMETITSESFPINRVIMDFLGETEKPADMAKWLADNPGEARRISRMSEAVAVRALEKAEARIATKPAPKITNAPPPPPTVNGRGTPSFDPEKASMDDYAKHWEQRRAKAGIRG
jgi:hypothetical protein